eukprot:1146110-Pelagomonas_calceolata.AAC.1
MASCRGMAPLLLGWLQACANGFIEDENIQTTRGTRWAWHRMFRHVQRQITAAALLSIARLTQLLSPFN